MRCAVELLQSRGEPVARDRHQVGSIDVGPSFSSLRTCGMVDAEMGELINQVWELARRSKGASPENLEKDYLRQILGLVMTADAL